MPCRLTLKHCSLLYLYSNSELLIGHYFATQGGIQHIVMRVWSPFNIISGRYVVAQVGCVSEFRNFKPSCACASVIFLYVCLRFSLFIYCIAVTVYLYIRTNWILEVSQMKIKTRFYSRMYGYCYFSRRGNIALSISVHGVDRWTRARIRTSALWKIRK